MGFWHTGYIEFHQSTGVDDFIYRPLPPPRHCCEQCPRHFAEVDELRRHRFEQHPLRQPSLFVRGRALGQLPLIVIARLQSTEVVVEDATICLLDGKAVEPISLGKYLAKMNRGFVEIQLKNDGTTSHWMIDFRIAEEAHMQGVESAFANMVKSRTLTIDTVARFIQDCDDYASAKPYLHGICQYLYGVMAKEQAPDSGLRADQYSEKFLQAKDILSEIDRPLARSIRALVAFHFNQFVDAEMLAPEGGLKRASGAFAGLLQGLSWHFEMTSPLKAASAMEHLLTDQDTLQLLADSCHSVEELESFAEDLLARLSRHPSGYDRLKRVLLAAVSLAARNDASSHAQARKLAREWVGPADTSLWAQALLEKLGAP